MDIETVRTLCILACNGLDTKLLDNFDDYGAGLSDGIKQVIRAIEGNPQDLERLAKGQYVSLYAEETESTSDY